MAFTPEQQRAVSSDGSLIVSAGAGSGKTTVMIARIVEKLKAGANLDEMLIVTFTRAAAASIKTKLVEELKKLKAHDPSVSARALDALPVSNIGTLHSFCQRLIKTYFYAAGIDPSATVCEEGEAGLYKRAAVRAAVDDAIKRGDPDFTELYEALRSRRGDDNFTETVESIVDFALSMPDPETYLNYQATDKDRLVELERIFTGKSQTILRALNDVKSDAAALNAAKIEGACGDLAAYIKGDIPFDAVAKTSVRKSDDALAALNERFKAVKADCKQFVSACAVAREAAERDSGKYSTAIKAVAADAKDRYDKRKRALCKLDYSDLEHGALRVLEDGSISAELADKIKFVFIDEFQDVNPLQARIADRLAALKTAEVFYVGDVKQSIYGFRRCSPEFFRGKLNDPTGNKVVLNMNFRSSRAVVDFVNKVFEPLMTEGFGGVDYKTEPLVPRPDAEEGEAGLYIIEDGIEDDVEECESVGIYSVKNATARTALDPEAVFVTKSILDYVNEDDSRSFSDVAVLVRSLGSRFCDDLKTLFERYRIPSRFGKDPPLSAGPETKALLDILRCVDNRYDDLALYTALRSPMGGFSDSELLEIAKTGEKLAVKNKIEPARSGGRRTYAFWQKAAAYRGALKSRLDGFYKLRGEFAAFSLCHDAADTLGYITSRIEYFRHVYDNFGSDAAAKTEAFVNAATSCADCHSFIKLCDDTDFRLDAGSGGDAVTVMTMHGSKGLEYDFVIVADTAHRFNTSDTTDRVIISENGVAVKIPDAERKILIPSVPWLVENATLPLKLKQEELRLLYVALTRARKKLVVCGKRRGVGKSNCMLGFIDAEKTGFASVVEPHIETSDAVVESLPVNADIVSAVKARIEKPYISGASLVKTSVTKLSDSNERDEGAFVPVLFDDGSEEQNKSFTDDDARERGTLYHKAMELVDFDKPDYDALAEVEGMDAVDMSVIKRAVSSLRRLTVGAAYCFKERYFIADLPRRDVTGEGEGNILVQGVIDLLILDGKGNATIVDYKTTRLDKLFSAGYVKQLGLYAKAVEKTGALKVKDAYLYSFVNGELYEVKL